MNLFGKNSKKEKYAFCHIPKTAGTSFRKALEKNYNVISDYGLDNPQTHKLIQSFIYDKNDFHGLIKALNKMSFFLSGHHSLNKYIDVVGVDKTVTFLRHPLQQVISHFYHHKKYFNEQREIEEFVKISKFKNSQYRLLKSLPLGMLGYIGITEDYSGSVRMINEYLDLEIVSLVENVNSDRATNIESIDDELKANILQLNSLDEALYNEAVWLHEYRKEFAKLNKVWTHGYAKITPKNNLVGAAYRKDCNKPVNIKIMANNDLVREVLANEFMTEFPKARVPRDRYIRFNVPLGKAVDSSNTIDVVVSDTDQKVNFQPLFLN